MLCCPILTADHQADTCDMVRNLFFLFMISRQHESLLIKASVKLQMGVQAVIFSLFLQAVDNLVRSCAADTSTAALQQFLQSNGNGAYYNRNFACTGTDIEWQPHAAAIDRTLYCGYRQVCISSPCMGCS